MRLYGSPDRSSASERLLAGLAVTILFSSTVALLTVLHFYGKPRETLADRVSLHFLNISVPGHDAACDAPKLEAWDSSLFVVGKPTGNFRDNLKNDTSYITTWCSGGFTNEFIEYVNLIYLSILAERVPVIPPFAPHEHISREAGVLPFGEIFNLTGLRSALHLPVLEWSDIKTLPPIGYPEAYPDTPMEPLGCWSTRPDTDGAYHSSNLMNHMRIDPSFTRLPEKTRETPFFPGFVISAQLAAAVHSKSSNVDPNGFPLMEESETLHHKLAPDEKMTCIDQLYFLTSGVEAYEWVYHWSPAWRHVGRHITFNRYLLTRADGYLRRAFRLESALALPKFIAVHVRHGDFQSKCRSSGTCGSTFDPFAEAVEQIKRRLSEERGIVTSHVLVSSDETDPEFWKEVSSRGWNYIDHDAERTFEKYGEWHTPLVDVVVQSLASGFVGTLDSTFSLVSGRRVEDWNDGFYTVVRIMR